MRGSKIMDTPIFSFLFSILHLILVFKSADSKCPQTFECGELGSLEFPLTPSSQPECGLYLVDCSSRTNPRILFMDDGTWYDLLEKPAFSNRVRVRIQDLLPDRRCTTFRTGLSLPTNPSLSTLSFSPNLTIFVCENTTSNIPGIFHSYRNYTRCEPVFTVYYMYPGQDISTNISVPGTCYNRQLPAVQSSETMDSGDLFNILSDECYIEWTLSESCLSCRRRGGQCLFNRGEFYCSGGKGNSKKILLIGGLTLTALGMIFISIYFYIKRKYVFFKFLKFQKTEIMNQKDFECFMKKCGNNAPRRFKYSDLKKMTNSFTKKLGQGGYGSVYKGKLTDGSLVAVKILNVPKGNGEDFMNEVASISRTSHINIVTLLGFCFEGSKRALIYEFMPNGSLEKFIQNVSLSYEVGLGWEKLFGIALGIARGLEYLHRGCNTRILHFDIKPHNILLDKDLDPKISDFGLAKLCPNRSSIVQISEARGTIGYIAPEIYCRNFGDVSYKSDVYSYGMLVLEIVGMKKNNNSGADHTSETYFPQYIYKQLEIEVEKNGFDGIDVHLDESQFLKRKLTIVGLWCIQIDPRDRPSMSRVIEMLEGKPEFLEIPPKPYISSPERPAAIFSTSNSISFTL